MTRCETCRLLASLDCFCFCMLAASVRRDARHAGCSYQQTASVSACLPLPLEGKPYMQVAGISRLLLCLHACRFRYCCHVVYVCMHVCMDVCIYVCMYLCMYVCGCSWRGLVIKSGGKLPPHSRVYFAAVCHKSDLTRMAEVPLARDCLTFARDGLRRLKPFGGESYQAARIVWPIVGLTSHVPSQSWYTSGSKQSSSSKLPTSSSCSKSAWKAGFRQMHEKIQPATWSPIWEAGWPWPAWAQGPTVIFN
jgi:hypothetical protein